MTSHLNFFLKVEVFKQPIYTRVVDLYPVTINNMTLTRGIWAKISDITLTHQVITPNQLNLGHTDVMNPRRISFVCRNNNSTHLQFLPAIQNYPLLSERQTAEGLFPDLNQRMVKCNYPPCSYPIGTGLLITQSSELFRGVCRSTIQLIKFWGTCFYNWI